MNVPTTTTPVAAPRPASEAVTDRFEVAHLAVPQGRPVPPGFVIGAATAAYQIEGARHDDGRLDSIWDTFSHTPGAVVDGDTGDVACEHYHRFGEDVALMRRLGLQSYRFSTSWSRIVPDGRTVNAAGLDFYERLVDELLGAGISPWLTLYHWDLPQALEDRGGWTVRDTTDRFVEYAGVVHDRLGDRVRTWTTLNEPWCSAFLGYTAGMHAPGRTSVADGLAAAHHLLLGHGRVVQELRSRDASLELGLTLNFTVADPLDPADPRDVDAARRVDGQMNRIFLDPVFRGAYPADLLEDVHGMGLTDHVMDGDLEVISTPIDVLGVNYYNGEAIGHWQPEVALDDSVNGGRVTRSPFPAADSSFRHPRGLPVTAMDWEIQPDGLTRLLHRLHEEYTGPADVLLHVTENGAAFDDVPDADGFVDDVDRVAYVRAHLGAVLDAAEAGVPVRGYFYWSLLDNFEWAWGYAKRFGIVRVDYDTQVRTPKASALDLARIIATRVLPTSRPSTDGAGTTGATTDSTDTTATGDGAGTDERAGEREA